MRQAGLVAVFVVLVALGAVIGARVQERVPVAPPLPPGGDFTLASAEGPLSLGALRGSVVLIYFGYASCPDVCPTALALTAQALEALEPAERARVRVLFVSVDPERDSPELLAQYATHFHANVTGVTGSPDALAAIAARYGAAYRKSAVESATKYVVDHTSSTAVVAPDGRLVELLPHGTPPPRIVEVVRRWL